MFKLKSHSRANLQYAWNCILDIFSNMWFHGYLRNNGMNRTTEHSWNTQNSCSLGKMIAWICILGQRSNMWFNMQFHAVLEEDLIYNPIYKAKLATFEYACKSTYGLISIQSCTNHVDCMSQMIYLTNMVIHTKLLKQGLST